MKLYHLQKEYVSKFFNLKLVDNTCPLIFYEKYLT